MLTCRSRVDVDLWEIGDEAIEFYVHQCSYNFKSTSIINSKDLLKWVTQFTLSGTEEVLEGYELDLLGRADKETYLIQEHQICFQGHFLVQVQYALWYIHIVCHHWLRIFTGGFPF